MLGIALIIGNPNRLPLMIFDANSNFSDISSSRERLFSITSNSSEVFPSDLNFLEILKLLFAPILLFCFLDIKKPTYTIAYVGCVFYTSEEG